MEFGGISGSAALMNAALDGAWEWVEQAIDTNIVNAFESNEMHLWPREARDWNQRYDTVVLNKTHVNSISSVQMLDTGSCTCQQTTFSGCAVITDGLAGYIAVHECAACASASCNCGTLRPYQARINYYAGIFLNANLSNSMILAVVMKAREIMQQFLESNVSDLGSVNVVSWRSMDYSQTRAGPGKDSYIDDFIKKTYLTKYQIKRALSLRKTY